MIVFFLSQKQPEMVNFEHDDKNSQKDQKKAKIGQNALFHSFCKKQSWEQRQQGWTRT